MARQYLIPLLKAAGNALRRGNISRSYLYFDAAIEHVIPPFSILILASALGMAASLALWLPDQISLLHAQKLLLLSSEQFRLAGINLDLSLGIILGQVFYLISGLWMVKAPAFIYQQLLYAPVFIVWKVWQYFRVLLGKSSQGWVRTTRNGG